MTTRGTCQDCTRLWKEYAESVQGHLEALRQSLTHALHEDNLALMKSEWDERASERKRRKARNALNEHQVTHLVKKLETRAAHSGPSKKR